MSGSPKTKQPGGAEVEGGAQRASAWEWVAGGVSAVVVLGTIATLLYEAVAEPRVPPAIEIVQDTVLETATGTFVVQFRAHNRGGATAAGLTVEGELKSDTGTVEKAEVTIDYVPARSNRRAGLIFTHDPREHALQIRPMGYDVP